MATGRIGVTPNLRTRWSKAPAGGTTSLSGLDDNSVSLVYDAGFEAVYRNGVLLSRGNDYTATNGTTITLIDATIAGDIIEVFANQAIPLTSTYTQAVADGKFINNTLVDAKGDLITATAADTPSRIAVGNNEYVLTAASAESTGLKWKQQGLTLITSASFSGSTTIAVDNVFTSTYGNYIIDIVTTSGSGSAAQIQMQLRSGGSANTTSNYNNAGSAYSYAGATENSSSASGTTAFVMRTNGSQWCGRLEIMNPQASQLTWWLSQYADTAQGGYRGGYFNATTSFDGIQFINSGGTNVAGTIRVYGKAN